MPNWTFCWARVLSHQRNFRPGKRAGGVKVPAAHLLLPETQGRWPTMFVGAAAAATGSKATGSTARTEAIGAAEAGTALSRSSFPTLTEQEGEATWKVTLKYKATHLTARLSMNWLVLPAQLDASNAQQIFALNEQTDSESI